MADLIARLEAAEEGSRELDGRIWCVKHDCHFIEWDGAGVVYRETPNSGIRHTVSDRVLDYTTSLDAALTLVPEGYAVESFMIWPGEPSSLYLLETRYEQRSGSAGRSGYWHHAPMKRWAAKAPTPALALCIAALKAREKDGS